MAKTGKADYQIGPSLRIGFLVLDAGGYSGEGNPITKLDVRRAMNHAINRKVLLKTLLVDQLKLFIQHAIQLFLVVFKM